MIDPEDTFLDLAVLAAVGWTAIVLSYAWGVLLIHVTF
jgi:hypothetical protein